MSGKKRTITLTDRPPVVISDENWPLLASSSYHDYDGQYDFQSFRHWRGFIGVRQHADGRLLVYGTCSAQGCGSSSTREYNHKAGVKLDAGADIVAAINEVHRDIMARGVSESWASLSDECIADLPAEELT